ncbi:MAG: hypothetical protein ACLUD2_03700 [Clostridium sp.]
MISYMVPVPIGNAEKRGEPGMRRVIHVIRHIFVILKDELIPAMGCTEPIALAYSSKKQEEQENLPVRGAGCGDGQNMAAAALS